ncbi:hypothetical protein Tco_0366130 [Tanacetum coccineum]
MKKIAILEDESIDMGFAHFSTIITSLKALNESFSSKRYVRKFLRALHPKWRPKVTAIEESKDLSGLSLDELIGNLKVYEMVIEKFSEIIKGKKDKYKSIVLKVKMASSKDKTSTSGSEDEKYNIDVRDFKSSLNEEESSQDQKDFVGMSWSDSDEDDDESKKDEVCLMAQDSNKVLKTKRELLENEAYELKEKVNRLERS